MAAEIYAYDGGGILRCIDHVGAVWPAHTRADLIYEANASGRSVRLCGDRRQVGLILDVVEGSRHGGFSAQLATPQLCRAGGAADRVLARMRACSLPASAGGWREATGLDYLSYALLAAGDGEDALDLVKKHPVYAPLTFMPRFCPDAAVRVFSDILDPRWFVDVDHPERCGRLRRYLGLDDHTVRRLVDGCSAAGRVERCGNVVRLWYDERDAADQSDAFPWSTYWRHGGGPRGLLRASQRVLSLVRALWMSHLHPELSFRPENFFSEAEAEVFRRHLTGT